jgi:hypothetical protein
MLFDLRGPGRRRLVKVVYVTLAFLLGGGLVLFGIGGDVSGGLVDAITERGAGGDENTDRLRDRERQLEQRVAANRQDVAAYAELARARVQLASQGDNFDPDRQTYTAAGQAELRQASQAWDRHLQLAKGDPDDRVASLMVQAYASLNQIDQAVRAQEVVAESRDAAGPYASLATLAYQAGQTRKGDLASRRALDLTEPDMRQALKGQLDQAKQQALQQSIEGATGGAAGGAAGGAPAVPTPSGG